MDEMRKYWVATLADADFDVADAFKVAITTPATGSYRLQVDAYGTTACLETWAEGATISAAGTALVWRSVERSDALEDATHVVLAEYAGTYTGGTTIFTKSDRDPNSMEFELKASTIYSITFTSAAADNHASIVLMLSKRR